MNASKLKVVPKPWGKEIWFARAKKYVGKILIIKKGKRLSRQYHKVKHETLYTDQGRYVLELGAKGAEKKVMKQGDVFVVKPRTIHRMHAKYCDVKIIEVSTPELWDVVRLQDDYGRSGK
ncbi:MAG: cupin domain-containing protein [Elusimicrobiota bacterium]